MPQLAMNNTPSIFIGSSSEGVEVAHILQSQLQEFRAHVWDQGLFTPGRYPLEVLDKQVKTRDFAVFVCTPDDPIIKRNCQGIAARDNVIFELGLFMGAMGRERSFMLLPDKIHVELPSDLAAITQIRYDHEKFQLEYPDKIAALCSASLSLRNQIGIAWGQMQEKHRKRIQGIIADQRTKSLRRLYSFIVQMRDLIIAFPVQLFEAISDLQRFEAVKLKAANSVDQLTRIFHEDADTSSVIPEMNGLAVATKTALTRFPFPIDHGMVGNSLRESVSTLAGQIAANIISGKDSLSGIGSMIEVEIQSQLRAFIGKYQIWWNESKSDIESATSILQDSLMTSSLMLNDHLSSEYKER